LENLAFHRARRVLSASRGVIAIVDVSTAHGRGALESRSLCPLHRQALARDTEFLVAHRDEFSCECLSVFARDHLARREG